MRITLSDITSIIVDDHVKLTRGEDPEGFSDMIMHQVTVTTDRICYISDLLYGVLVVLYHVDLDEYLRVKAIIAMVAGVEIEAEDHDLVVLPGNLP
jgi:hypothetical protein